MTVQNDAVLIMFILLITFIWLDSSGKLKGIVDAANGNTNVANNLIKDAQTTLTTSTPINLPSDKTISTGMPQGSYDPLGLANPINNSFAIGSVAGINA